MDAEQRRVLWVALSGIIAMTCHFLWNGQGVVPVNAGPPGATAEATTPPVPREANTADPAPASDPPKLAQVDPTAEPPSTPSTQEPDHPAPRELSPPPAEHARELGEESREMVKAVIDHELRDATEEERHIWYEDLKSLPPAMVRDLLQIRKQLVGLPRLNPLAPGGIPLARELHRQEGLPQLNDDQLSNPTRERYVPTPPAAEPSRSPDEAARKALLRVARRVMRFNLLHAETPGFKRRVVRLVESGSPLGTGPVPPDVLPAIEGAERLPRAELPQFAGTSWGGLRLVAEQARPQRLPRTITRTSGATELLPQLGDPWPAIEIEIDHRPGVIVGSDWLREPPNVAIEGTGWLREPLHVAIEGTGYFVVQLDADGNLGYTRRGELTILPTGELGIRSRDGGVPLVPPVTIPAESRSIKISPDGQVSVLQPDSMEWVLVGQIELAAVLDPLHLLPIGECFFRLQSGSDSTWARRGKPAHNTLLRQGMLELSNVQPNLERDAFHRLEKLLDECVEPID